MVSSRLSFIGFNEESVIRFGLDQSIRCNDDYFEIEYVDVNGRLLQNISYPLKAVYDNNSDYFNHVFEEIYEKYNSNC